MRNKLLAMNDVAVQIGKEGCAIVEGVIDADTIDGLIKAIDSLSGESHGLRNLHERCDAVRRLCEDEQLLKLARGLIGQNAFVVRSLFFDKNDKANWKVAWHQDLTIAVSEKIETAGFSAWSVKERMVHVQPPVGVLERMVTLRLHLDDCSSDNGPLRVLPGSHVHGKLSAEQIVALRRETNEFVCEVQGGGVVIMKPLILHASSQAVVPKHRRVVHLEFAAEELPNGLRWITEPNGISIALKACFVKKA
jgi:ectoine hydroxylase-related dioxygenase (phytanoyl-CoA dioxygenase family)